MDELIITEQNIQNKIYTIRDIQVMLDRDFSRSQAPAWECIQQ